MAAITIQTRCPGACELDLLVDKDTELVVFTALVIVIRSIGGEASPKRKTVFGDPPPHCRFSFAYASTPAQIFGEHWQVVLKKNHHSSKAPARQPGRGYRTFIFFLVIALITLNWWLWHVASTREVRTQPQQSADPIPYQTEPDATVFATYGGSRSCQECHEKEYTAWTNSHHALAERLVEPAVDRPSFVPPQEFGHGKQNSEAFATNGQFELLALGLKGKQAFPLERVIGVDPLRQFLVAEPRGRFQVTELATDSRTNDWFDVYGKEDRQPGEWGHWTGRGMTWNTMCAFCHNTRVRKNYDFGSDTFHTAYKEHGVSCESCHGPMADHNAWQQEHRGNKKGDPTIRRLDKQLSMEYCGACHARRNDLTGDFHPGQRFFDHYLLTIPDDTDTYYSDGQVRDENFEFTAFLGSRMHLAGVTCMNCHDPHTGKRLLAGNALCMQCHEKPSLEFPMAKPIDPATHSFHKPTTAGDLCTDCHMPQTVYMARHWRHDHGFTIPDPLLTKQFNIPNACNRCHQDKTVDWSMEYCEKWYGDKMNRHTRTRAQWVAQGRAGTTNAQANLITMIEQEDIPLWRAVAAGLLKFWAGETNVAAALVKCALDQSPLVRSVAAQSLEFVPPQTYPEAEGTLRQLLNDPCRAVRVRAAWALRRSIDLTNVAAKDLLLSLEQTCDHPSGLMQLGVWNLDRGNPEAALVNFKRAVEWDPGSAPLRQALAVAYSIRGESAKAVTELEAACRLAPREAEYRYKLGLALNEVGKLTEASSALEEATNLNPQYSRAWYNLGLAYSAQNMPERAVEALSKAEQLEPNSAQIPYALATVHARLGQVAAARSAAQRALEIQPGYPDAQLLLQQLP